MPLLLIGLGLGDESDITQRGRTLLRSAEKVYLEYYTSLLCNADSLQSVTNSTTHDFEKPVMLCGRSASIAGREFIEDGTQLLCEAKTQSVALLVVGDPFGATTHSDLYVRCVRSQIPVEVVHNASIINAIGCTGLQLYRFGSTITLCLWTESWKPESWYSALEGNLSRGLHTLVLLDIKIREQTEDSLARGSLSQRQYLSPRFMTSREGADQLLEVSQRQPHSLISASSKIVAVARIGSSSQAIAYCTLGELAEGAADEVLGGPLHSLVVPAPELHECEMSHLQCIAWTSSG